ncbi:hypothetical protein AB0C33_03600 [Nonomuraea sp. NPDC048881]|uniref:hypothetical protein n=1 Tax=Nonomuraea sp. NPDC048881 TaxID=3155030 RepID=UPI0033F58051
MSPDKVRKKRQRGSSLTAQPPPRAANRIFYAVAEGAVTEYDYLTMLQNAFSRQCSFRIDMPKYRSDDMKPWKVAQRALTVGALSHPSFDFWLYLHYGLYDQPQDGRNHQVHQLLSQRPGFAGFGARDKRITKARADHLMPRLKTAFDNARSLDRRCASGRCSHPRGSEPRCGLLAQDPSSGMWRLLESLGIPPFL